MSHNDALPLAFPVEIYDLPWAAKIVNTTRDELVELFGPPTEITDPGDPQAMERWAFRYDCGLQVVFQLNVHENHTFVIPDIPEILHVGRHLPFPRSRIELITDSELEDQIQLALRLYPQRQTDFDGLAIAQVWRQGDDGNPIPVDVPTSERAAKCRIAELESHKHKQIYWYSKQ